jgi:hypothetical protein
MKHVTYADKSHLMGDGAADTLLEHARLLADNEHADTVTLTAISPDGNAVEASFLLTPSSVLMVESTNSDVAPPDNTNAIADMRDRIDAITHPLAAETESKAPCSQVDYDLPEPH